MNISRRDFMKLFGKVSAAGAAVAAVPKAIEAEVLKTPASPFKPGVPIAGETRVMVSAISPDVFDIGVPNHIRTSEMIVRSASVSSEVEYDYAQALRADRAVPDMVQSKSSLRIVDLEVYIDDKVIYGIRTGDRCHITFDHVNHMANVEIPEHLKPNRMPAICTRMDVHESANELTMLNLQFREII